VCAVLFLLARRSSTTREKKRNQCPFKVQPLHWQYPFEVQPLHWHREPDNTLWRKFTDEVLLENVKRISTERQRKYQDICDFIERELPSTGRLQIVEIGSLLGSSVSMLDACFPGTTIVAVNSLLAGYSAKDDPFFISSWSKNLHLTDEETSQSWAYSMLYNFRKNCYRLVHALPVVAGHAFLHDENIGQFDVAIIDTIDDDEDIRSTIQIFIQLLKGGGVLIVTNYVDPFVSKAVNEVIEKGTGMKLSSLGANAGITLPTIGEHFHGWQS